MWTSVLALGMLQRLVVAKHVTFSFRLVTTLAEEVPSAWSIDDLEGGGLRSGILRVHANIDRDR